MNERIEKISEQARQYADSMYPSGLDIGKWGPAYQEKFAELIVQKCADIGERYADGNYEVRNQILEHFGLEEPEE
jgi:hypothetical protein